MLRQYRISHLGVPILALSLSMIFGGLTTLQWGVEVGGPLATAVAMAALPGLWRAARPPTVRLEFWPVTVAPRR